MTNVDMNAALAGNTEIQTDGRPLSLRQIEVFHAIMQAGSISGAGRSLHVSQPAISRVLALAEYRLGYQLFERSKNRLLPTPEARRLYAEVQSLYAAIGRLNALALQLGNGSASTLNIISSASLSQRLIPQVLTQLRVSSPRAQVDYRTTSFDEIVAYFLSGQADVAVSLADPVHPLLQSRKLADSEIVCAVPITHALAEQTEIMAADFASHPWISYPEDAPLGKVLHQFLSSSASKPTRPALTVRSPLAAYALAQQGFGAALMERWALPSVLDPTVVIKPVSPAQSIGIWLTVSELNSLSLAGKRFISSLEQLLS